jgi:DNA-binding NarL/FixJ family response regulator
VQTDRNRGSAERNPDCLVLLVDDHPITRKGIRTLIEAAPGFTVCGEADDVETAKVLAGQLQPAIVVVDISLKGSDGLELIRRLKAVAPDTAVLVVSMHDEQFYAARARQAGAAGFINKQLASDQIVPALARLRAGAVLWADALKPSRRIFKDDGPKGLESLSNREAEVLRLIGDGFATREIASRLGLSTKTIDTYREHLKRKLELNDGAALSHFAISWRAGQDRGC